jgi:prepilin-type N-terminal cleavage/methylation domain-containing protein
VSAEGGRAECGFSLVELLVAMALLLIVLAGVFETLDPARDRSLSNAEAIDLQQRLRVAADTISRELRAAGNGPQQGNHAGPLVDAWAPILPFRQGRRNPDPVGTAKSDTLTLLRVVPGAAQTTLAAGFVAQSGTVAIAAGPGPANASCGFRAGTDVVIFDGTGAYDTFSITAVAGNLLTLQHNMSAGTTYGVGATIAEVTSTTFFLKTDPVTTVTQLVAYNGGAGSDAPMVDNVTKLEFTMFGTADTP